ncbi:MAG: DNA gyrase subunit A [bacterium]
MKKETIIPIYIEDEMKNSYLDYAMSVIIGRALPDVRDGLKPVHRRVLYAMNELGMDSDKPYKKSARIVGEVLGKYHPHGDMAVYDSIVRMVQDFSHRYPLINGQGNFGSIDADAPAAMRYTEVRLHKFAEELLKDIDKQTVDFVPNFDETLKEPTVLPANLPNLLLNGSSGIAVGMATNIPPHNLGELVDGIIALIDNPAIDISELIQTILGPDFPTGGSIFGIDGIKESYTTGRGKIILRANATTESLKSGKEAIIITEIPYQVNKKSLIEKIAELVKTKKIEGISALRDESDRDGIRIFIELKRDENPQVILNQLYKHTQMQVTFGVIMLALVDNQPKVLNLKEIMELYLKHRQEVIIRRTKYDLKLAEERAHILEGLKIALANLDQVIKTIKKSKSPQEARVALIAQFELTEKQAQAILEMQLQRLTALEQDKLNAEYLALIKTIAELKSILDSKQKVMNLIKNDLLKIKKDYADPRRTQIIKEAVEFNMEDLIADENMVITISHTGYIKRLPLTTYKMQHRGGVGVTGMIPKEEDFVDQLYIASTHNYILFFTTKGRVYWLKVYDLPEGGRTSRGKAIVNLLKLSEDEKIATSIPIAEFNEQDYLIMATRKGLVKKTRLIEYSRPRSGGIIALSLIGDDELIKVERTNGNDDIILSTMSGKAIKFSESQVRPTGRTASGVRGIKLRKGDYVVGMEVARQGWTLLTITANGYGKRTEFDAYRRQSRGGMGVIDIKTEPRNGPVVSIYEVNDDTEVIMITASGMIIRCPARGISTIGRNTQGVRLIRLKEGDKVVDAAPVVSEEKEIIALN